MYIWNIFALIGPAPALLNPILKRVENSLEEIEKNLGLEIISSK